MRRFNRAVANMAVGTFAIGVMASSAYAETLDLVCATASDSQPRSVVIDLTMALVFNGAGNDARRWPTRVTDKDVTWDEIFDSHIGHFANHYVYERASGALRGTDMAGHEILSDVCHKA